MNDPTTPDPNLKPQRQPVTLIRRIVSCQDADGVVWVEPAHFTSESEREHLGDDEGISIVQLGPGQALRLTAIAKKVRATRTLMRSQLSCH